MLMLVSYDVDTTTSEGKRRLRRLAKACVNMGIRVQYSVFECNVDWSQWVKLKSQLQDICDPKTDSLRFYNLGNSYSTKVEHYGAKPTPDTDSDTLLI